MLGDGDDVGASDLSDGDTSVGLVGRIEVDVVGTNTRSDGELELLSLGQSLCGQVTWVEAKSISSARCHEMGISSTYGVVMMTSASTRCLSNSEFSPSLSEVVTSS